MWPLGFYKSMKTVATIASIRQETPTVKSFVLELGNAGFSFLPGQWVDFSIDTGRSIEVGGFSITSSPLQKGSIELAIKKVPSGAPSVYMHEQAKVGDSFVIEGGSGDFYYQKTMGTTLLLVAGGIGITPLMSMLRYVDQAHPDVQATLLYSAKTPSELLFLEKLREMAARNPRIHCVFTVTQPLQEPWDGPIGRIDRAMLAEHLPGKEGILYLCGPLPMVDDMEDLLAGLGVKPSRIKAERWW